MYTKAVDKLMLVVAHTVYKHRLFCSPKPLHPPLPQLLLTQLTTLHSWPPHPPITFAPSTPPSPLHPRQRGPAHEVPKLLITTTTIIITYPISLLSTTSAIPSRASSHTPAPSATKPTTHLASIPIIPIFTPSTCRTSPTLRPTTTTTTATMYTSCLTGSTFPSLPKRLVCARAPFRV